MSHQVDLARVGGTFIFISNKGFSLQVDHNKLITCQCFWEHLAYSDTVIWFILSFTGILNLHIEEFSSGYRTIYDQTLF